MYWAEKGSTKTLNPSLSRTKSSSPLRSSMTRLYLKPLHPPGCTATRRPPTSPLTPSASMNFFTSTTACGVRVSSISDEIEADITYLLILENYWYHAVYGRGNSVRRSKFPYLRIRRLENRLLAE